MPNKEEKKFQPKSEDKTIKFEDIVHAMDQLICQDEDFMVDCIKNAIKKANEAKKVLHDIIVDASDEDTILKSFEQVGDILNDPDKYKNYPAWLILQIDYSCNPNYIVSTFFTRKYEGAYHVVKMLIQDKANEEKWGDIKNVRLKIIQEHAFNLIFDLPDHKFRIHLELDALENIE